MVCKVISEDRKTRRFVYESPAYRFTCDARVTDDAVRNFSVMFETLRKYAQAITPYSWGYFKPDIYGNVVKSYVTAAWARMGVQIRFGG